MTEILAVFRSRTQAIDYKCRLNAQGIPAAIVVTPSQLNLGCGYSVKFTASVQAAAKNVMARAKYTAFYGYITLIDGKIMRSGMR